MARSSSLHGVSSKALCKWYLYVAIADKVHPAGTSFT